ncbi:MAG: histidine ammonia-lyase [Haloplasmataceae bacterium]|nr:histidine ammonia-lyase [Haloplasmataceae bacterium]
MLFLDGNSLNLDDFIKVVRYKEKVELSKISRQKVNDARKVIDKIVNEELIVYGVNTGFGKLANVVISKDDVCKLQENLLKSHACGIGELFNEEVVRGIMLLRINALAKGFSGIRLSTIEKLITFLNDNIIPCIPEKGSLGASGDLAPLSHMALALLGLGEVIYQGEIMSAAIALKLAGIKPVDKLMAKEGLSLINGTQVMTSVGAITTYDAIQLSKTLDIAGSLTMEALYGIKDAFNLEVHHTRPHLGQIDCAKNILKLVENSQFITKQGEKRVQDPYSIRCIPQVHGASKDALMYVKDKIEIEMNSATDNPLIIGDQVISCGNFHGQPMALSFDYLKIAIAEMANISERRIERLVNPQLSEGLPAFLVLNKGLNSGFMIMQYTAASLVSENKVIAHPASVDSIPSSANQEDHVSMGTIASRGARDIFNNARIVIAIELMTSCQAIDLREKKQLGNGTIEAYHVIRNYINFIDEDVIMYPLINQIEELIKSEIVLKAVENKIGMLN